MAGADQIRDRSEDRRSVTGSRPEGRRSEKGGRSGDRRSVTGSRPAGRRSVKQRRPAADLVWLAVPLLLMSLVYFIPTDTSLALVQDAGIIRACVPGSLPPFITGNPAAPGVDVDILTALARELDVRLVLNTNPSIGQDWNPRNWRVTRAQCQIIAGGVVDTETMRSFLDTTPAYMETGWALLSAGSGHGQPLADEPLPGPLGGAFSAGDGSYDGSGSGKPGGGSLPNFEGENVGFFAGNSGLDRLPLSRFLRDQGARPITVPGSQQLIDGMQSGRFSLGVAEAVAARHIAGVNGLHVQWLPPELGRHSIVFGLWKGDLTLKRALVKAMETLRRSGELDRIIEKYNLIPIED